MSDAKRQAKESLAFNTLYGAAKLVDFGGTNKLRNCYFFDQSDFFRYRDLDGAYLALDHGDSAVVKLCLNPYSAAWTTLRDSPFAKCLKHGLIDPEAGLRKGMAMIADTEIDRKDADAVLAYLRTKYSIERLLRMTMMMASAAVATPRE